MSEPDKDYYIDKRLKNQWDKIKGDKLMKLDEDRVYIVDGRERMGKSTFAFQQAKYIDPTFNVDRICFTPEEFIEQIRNAPQGSAIVFDEAFRGLSSKASQSKINKKIVQAMMEMGQRNLVVFIVLPTFFLLELYAAVLRTNTLFHIYKDKNQRRAFRVYNYPKKSLLYRVGKKKGFDYSYPRVKVSGRFYGKDAIDREAYVKKKLKSLRELHDGKDQEEEEKVLESDQIIHAIRKGGEYSERGLSKVLQKGGKVISAAKIGNICRRIEQIKPLPTA